MNNFNANQETEILIDLKKANLLSIIITVSVAAGTALMQFLHWKTFNFSISLLEAAAFVIFLFVHEGLHGVGFLLWGRAGLKEVKIGVIWKYLMPYCACSRLLSRQAYLKAMLLPVAATGIFSVVYIVSNPNFFWSMFAGVVVGGGAGDIMMAREVLKCPADAVFRDHPSLPGFFYRKNRERGSCQSISEEN